MNNIVLSAFYGLLDFFHEKEYSFIYSLYVIEYEKFENTNKKYKINTFSRQTFIIIFFPIRLLTFHYIIN